MIGAKSDVKERDFAAVIVSQHTLFICGDTGFLLIHSGFAARPTKNVKLSEYLFSQACKVKKKRTSCYILQITEIH
jgi:hypothetical protein